MFDIHYHLLYGVDDGPKTLEDSLALAEASIREGVTHIVATPHANGRYAFQPDVIREQLLELDRRLGGRVALGSGCDFHLTFDNIEDALAHPQKYTINGGSYLLIEFAQHGIPAGLDEAMFRLINTGLKLIITHPERSIPLIGNAERLEKWVYSGCLLQVTADSLLGRFGKQAQSISRQFLKRNWVHFVASDAHNLERRPPRMAPAYKFVQDEFGGETAKRLFLLNPRAAFMNEEMPTQPEPESLSGSHRRRSEAKSGFLSRLFGRS